MNPHDEVGFKPGVRSPALPVLVHAVLWIGLGILLYFVMPRIAWTFADFGVDLPDMTVLAIQASGFVIKYYWLVLPVLMLLAAGDWAILAHLRRLPDGRRAEWIWSGLMVAVPLGVLAFLAVAILIPLTHITTPLSG
jgi:type II secretory pathway component PulF